MNSKKKRNITIIAGGLLVLLYCIIFLFSSQDGDTSGSISMSISMQGVKFWEEISNKELAADTALTIAEFWEHLIRKGAHFTEYAVMGVLIYTIVNCYVKDKKKRYLLAVVWVFISAALDELHQYFVPGRWGCFSDVLLDTCGGATGAFLCAMIIVRAKRKSRQAS